MEKHDLVCPVRQGVSEHLIDMRAIRLAVEVLDLDYEPDRLGASSTPDHHVGLGRWEQAPNEQRALTRPNIPVEHLFPAPY